MFRSSCPEVFCGKGVLRNFIQFAGKHLCQSLFLKEKFWHRCFHMNFAKFLRTPFLAKHLWWLLLVVQTDLILHPKKLKDFTKYHQVTSHYCDRDGYIIFFVNFHFQRIQVFTYVQFILMKLASNVIFRKIIS